MLIDDDVYGSHQVTEDLLLDLLSSQAISRLKDVSQAGASSLVRGGRSVNRFEHSVGVMLLTRQLGGSVLEQAAGLLQDVSHTAFSHTIDYVFKDRSEQFHERIFSEVVGSSDLPSILNRHALTWEMVFSPDNLPIVDASAPLLCADRIDYTLRDLIRFGHVTRERARMFISSLELHDRIVVCSDPDLAEEFVRWYAFLVQHLFMNPLELYAHEVLATIIRDALQEGVLIDADLRGVDSHVLKKLQEDDRARRRLVDLRTTAEVVADESSDLRIFSKGRIVDPPVFYLDRIVPLSSIKPDLSALWVEIRRISREGVGLRRIS